jgi:hypothetical protein
MGLTRMIALIVKTSGIFQGLFVCFGYVGVILGLCDSINFERVKVDVTV